MIENLENEIWKDINGWEGLYQISNYGRVKSLSKYLYNGYGYFWSKEKIMKLTNNQDGYLRIHLRNNGKRKVYSVHRLVAEAFIPNPNNLPEVNHKDEDTSNSKVDNLEWCTSKYNSNYGNHCKNLSNSLKDYWQSKYKEAI